MRPNLVLALAFSLLASAASATEPVRLVRFAGTPADSSERAQFLSGFNEAFDAGTVSIARSAGPSAPSAERPQPFARVDASANDKWLLDLSVRFGPEVRVPVPKRRNSDPTPRPRRSTLRTSRGFIVAVAVSRVGEGGRGQTFEPIRYELYFADLKRVVVPSAKLPGGAYDFPFDQAGRVVARAALEGLLRASGALASGEVVDLSPATRVENGAAVEEDR